MKFRILPSSNLLITADNHDREELAYDLRRGARDSARVDRDLECTQWAWLWAIRVDQRGRALRHDRSAMLRHRHDDRRRQHPWILRQGLEVRGVHVPRLPGRTCLARPDGLHARRRLWRRALQSSAAL